MYHGAPRADARAECELWAVSKILATVGPLVRIAAVSSGEAVVLEPLLQSTHVGCVDACLLDASNRYMLSPFKPHRPVREELDEIRRATPVARLTLQTDDGVGNGTGTGGSSR